MSKLIIKKITRLVPIKYEIFLKNEDIFEKIEYECLHVSDFIDYMETRGFVVTDKYSRYPEFLGLYAFYGGKNAVRYENDEMLDYCMR